MEYTSRYMAGRCANGAGRDSGPRWHAVPNSGFWYMAKALCGRAPKIQWSSDIADRPAPPVNCPACLKRLATKTSKTATDMESATTPLPSPPITTAPAYAPATDKRGNTLHPGDKVSFKTYPRGAARGVVVVSARTKELLPDGSVLPALAIERESANGTVYSLVTSGVLKLDKQS